MPDLESDAVQALVLDHITEDCVALVNYLRAGGYESVAVASVRQAREALEQGSFDLFVLEMELPDGDGLQLCNEIRERLGDGLMIMFVSSQNMPAQRVTAFQLGADDVLGKPCNGEELIARIDAHRRRRQAHAAG